MTFLRSLLHSQELFWLLLALPSLPLLADLWWAERYYAEIMYESGLLSVQFTVLALAITPLLQLVKDWSPGRKIMLWLQKRRRAIGVTAFGYAAIHTTFYVRETGSLELVWLDIPEPELAVGWIAMVLFLVLAITSNSGSVRWLKSKWKPLQRLAYLAAAFTALHWWLIGQFQKDLLIWFVPIAVLQLVRILKLART